MLSVERKLLLLLLLLMFFVAPWVRCHAERSPPPPPPPPRPSSPPSSPPDTTSYASDDPYDLEETSGGSCRMGYSARSYYPTEGGYYGRRTCFWCYAFIPQHRRTTSLNLTTQGVRLSDGTTLTEVVFTADNTTYHFDPEDTEAWEYVADSLDQLEAEKLAQCCRDAVRCCEDELARPKAVDGYCPGTWDGWVCFPPTAPDTTVTFPCPQYGYKGLPECTLEGQKHCQSDGNWTANENGVEVTDYSICSHRHHHLVAYTWDAATHGVSLLAVPVALLMILSYRQLRIHQRFVLHANLFSALLGKALFNLLEVVILRIPEYLQSASALDRNTSGCKVLVVVTKGFNLAVWTWMLAESLYLHRLIVAAFRGGGKTWVYLLIGWVPAWVLVGSWAAAKGSLEDHSCWLGDDPSTSHNLHLILDLPKLAILVVNTVLLANMTRVLITKLQGVNADHATATRSAVKATIFLLPMFGLQFFLTLYLPPPSASCTLAQVYFFVATGLDGLQGLYVAVVYCFINKEVRLQVRRSLYRFKGRMYYTHDRSTTAHDPRTDVSLLSTSHAPSSPPPNTAITTTETASTTTTTT